MKRFHLTTTTALVSVAATAFDNKGGWKMDADGKIEMKDGNPVYLRADGGESVVDGETIGNLNREAQGHRQRAEKLEKDLKVFEGIDAEAAKKAIETVANIDAKTLIDAGKVEEVKQQITQQFQGQLEESKTLATNLQTALDASTIALGVAQSKFIGDNVAIPPEMFTSTFTKNFKVEDGKVVPYDLSGNPILSKEKIGERASIDEAFAIMVEAYPHKDSILKAVDARGSGNNGNGGNRQGNLPRYTRADFDKLQPGKQAEIAALVNKGEATLVD